MVDILLSYEGELADENQLEFYDAARALVGFQRTLALTTHLALNGELIVQAPSLKGASIIISTPRKGSWEVAATIVIASGVLAASKAPSHFKGLITSVLDYALSQTTGYSADFKELEQEYGNDLKLKDITPSKLDGLCERVETSVAEMHRPIVASETADHANIYAGKRPDKRLMLGHELNAESFEYLKNFELEKHETEVEGVVSSYNVNTYSGRFYHFEENRTVRFELLLPSRTVKNMRNITNSLRANATEKGRRDGEVLITGRRLVTKSGKIRSIKVTNVRSI